MSQFHDPYYLPSAQMNVPDSFKSDNSQRPISSSVQTVRVSSLSSAQSAGGHINVSVPTGMSAGIMCNPYLKFRLNITGAGNATTGTFAYSSKLCSALLERYVFSINGVQLDTINNAGHTWDQVISHSSSADFIRNDLAILMGANQSLTVSAGGALSRTFCMPLLGVLSAPSFPLYLCNGQVSIDIDLAQKAKAFVSANYDAGTNYTVDSVELIYDRITVGDDFIQSVKAEQSTGKNFVVPYTNLQSMAVPLSANNNFNLGVNLSSLNSVMLSQILTADLTTLANSKYSVNVGLTKFNVYLDGRLLNSADYNTQDGVGAVSFAESQKALSRLFDASVSDAVGDYNIATGLTTTSYLTKSFFAAASALRCNDRMAFSGSPASVINIAWDLGGANPSDYTGFILVASYQQLLIDATGNVSKLQ